LTLLSNEKVKTQIMYKKATAIILAGGKSSRMGDDKSFLIVNGEPLIKTIVDQLKSHFGEIIIGSNEIEKYSFLDIPVIPDIEKDKGPLMGIYSCVKASSNDINFVTACDIPVINVNFINNMINLSSNADIVIPIKDKDKYEPLFAIYKKSIIQEAEMLLKGGARKITELLNNLQYHTVCFNDQNWYINLNKKEDYIEYLKKSEQGKGNKGKRH